ncbi:F-box domain [Arabidopsis thaliana x Arabidopsis arenosa]|uniref:F-box domain n=1 Tax=Arabidopsis thaliana x Arabidopsis arenosa TaxID=1240361 RepID=A0A8T2A5I0_9BRAS|nr:F-box domain [Arabidopsis thaliana x Arabidopsis arenosa]
MIRGQTSDSIPIDLITEILSRLPAKSIARCRCVSKLWTSILDRPYFTKLFLTRSSARPRLFFAIKRADGWCFLTSPQPHSPYDKSSLVLVADFHIKFPGYMWPGFFGLNSGLIYFYHMLISEKDKDTVVPVPVICNPSTGQHMSLPNGNMKKGFLGFDPIEKQFKVLSVRLYNENQSPQVLTLGTGNVSWRKIHCPLKHYISYCEDGVCINGVLYYLGHRVDVWYRVIVCFDVSSEKFNFIDEEFFRRWPRTKLINYMGKLGAIIYEYVAFGDTMMYLIKDVMKPEQRQHVYFFGKDTFVDDSSVSVTSTGDVVWLIYDTSKLFYVFYFNPIRNTHQRVEIQGFEVNHDAFANRRNVRVFVDHVEDLNFIK